MFIAMTNLRYTFRQLRRSPGFTLTAVLILALGIGANAAIFTLVHAVLLRNLPVADPKTIIRLGDRQNCCVNSGMPQDNDYSLFSYDLYKHLQANAPEFEQLAAVQSSTWKMTVRGSKPDSQAQALPSEFVSGNYFQMLGLAPFAGRLLLPSDDLPGATPVAVISYQAWERDYALDRSVIGIGLYGVTSYTVARRTTEIGIRMALGADRGNVVGMVMREAMLQAGIGLAIGVPVAMLCVRFVKAQLYNMAGYDAAVLAAAIVALVLSAFIAGLIPARRAASTDPMHALRAE